MPFKIAWGKLGVDDVILTNVEFDTIESAIKALADNCAGQKPRWKRQSDVRFEQKQPDGGVMFLQVVDAETKAPASVPVSGVTANDFAREYEIALKNAVEKHPDEYMYGVDRVPEIAAKMVAALKAGNASIGPAVKAAARKCGIRPTLSAVKVLLNS